MSDAKRPEGATATRDPVDRPARSGGVATRAPVSVVIPAYNEASVIERCLQALTTGAEPLELDIVVACNGCTDDTAAIARRFGGPVRVVETEEASKIAALNLGDEAALNYPRFYVDADVVIDAAGLRALAAALDEDGVDAVSPRMDMDVSRASWAVRAFYAVWRRLPYTREGMIGVGSYGLSRAGRERFGRFPNVIADDGFVRLLFRHGERIEVPEATVTVTAPSTLADLVKIKTRSRLGGYQLRDLYPDLTSAEQAGKSYGGALGAVLFRPWLWPHAVVYGVVNVIARRRAARQLAEGRLDVWERDESSR